MHPVLEKILRRTKRDVALAGAMVGSIKALEVLLPQTESFGRLTVHFYGGGVRWWEWTPCPKGGTPWREFLRWYHGRPQSDSYVQPHTEGSTMIRRRDIMSYETYYGEREKSK